MKAKAHHTKPRPGIKSVPAGWVPAAGDAGREERNVALTLSETRKGAMGDLAYWFGAVTFDSSYASGGESFTPANAGMSVIDTLQVTSDHDTTSYMVAWDKSADKLMLFNSAGDGDPFDEAGADDASGFTCYVACWGKR